MRMKEIMPYIDLEKISCEFLHDILRSIQGLYHTPAQDRETLIQLMYADDALNWLDVGVDASGADVDFGFDDETADPLEAEAKELENKLMRAKISTELAKAAKTRTDAERVGYEADKARAEAEALPPHS
jgi:hypothetical protein